MNMRQIVFVVAFVALCGCVNNSNVTKQEDFEETDRSLWADEDYFAHAEYAVLEPKLRQSLESCDPVDRPMHRLQLASVLLLEGKQEEAHRTLSAAREELELLFDPEAEARALSLWHGEKEKVYKGDGWERATLYAFLGLSFLDLGDYASAVKCAENGILCDSDSEKMEYVADYALLPYVGYLAARRGGDRAKAEKFARLFKEAAGRELPEQARNPDALLVCWAGRGAAYALGGEFEEKRYVVPGSDRGELDAVSVASSGMEEAFSLSGIADLNYQATTRGGRLMDNVLSNKADVKRGFAASSNILLVMASSLFQVGGQSPVMMLVCYPSAGLLALFGGSSYLIGKAVTPRADDRIWSFLPGRLLVIPIKLRSGGSDFVLRGYRRWDNTLTTAPVSLSFRSGNLPVRHLSLIPSRGAMERAWQEGVRISGQDVSDRSQRQCNETKEELTGRND